MTQLSRRQWLLGFGGMLAASARALDGDAGSMPFAGSRVRFVGPDEARTLLSAEDEWMRATSPFQRRAVVGAGGPVDIAGFRRWNGDAARAWPAEQQARWRRALARLAPAFAALRIPLPPEVWLITTSGRESADAPYTRGAAVILPAAARPEGYSDEMLLAHELWHVASRHAPALATRLYAEIGFEPVPELVFPAAWEPLRIANPDAPANRHAMRLEIQGRRVLVTPVLVASRPRLLPGETFFHVMQPRLLELQPDADGRASHAVMRGEEPAWHALDGPHDYLRRLGGNTAYVIHHEEAMADNVALLATGAQARNPTLLARLRATLEAAR